MINELATMGTREITLSAKGEPACHPYFANIVNAIKDSGLELKISTNCTLYSPKIANAYARADHLIINLSAFDEASYQDIHAPKAPGQFNQVIKNIRLFSHLYNHKGHPLITLGYVICKNTFRQIDQAIAVARSCGVTSIRFKTIDPTPHTKAILLSQAERKELADNLTQLLKSPCDISHNLADIYQELAENKTPRTFGRCLVVSLAMDVAENGTVGLCGQNTKLKIGNWKQATLKTVWSQARTKRLQEQAAQRINFNNPLWRSCRLCSFSRIDYYINRLKHRGATTPHD